MTLHVVFTEDGLPGWIGPEPRDGSEPIEGLSIAFLAANRRNRNGKWVARKAVVAAPPTAAERAATEEAEFQARVEDRRRAVAEAMREEADPLLAEWLAGETEKAVWQAKRDEIRARYPKPERPA